MRTRPNTTVTEIPGGRWRAPEARRVLKWWRDSGLTAGEFARVNGLNVQRLIWWRKRLVEIKTVAVGPPSFVPVQVTAGPRSTIVRLPGGIAVEILDVAAVPPAWIGALAAELKRQS